ncbi:MAG TPA: VTT domain-containing protein [Blastocatellia bacterium]|nr:VTT domain-containing protein [Blastocatellia bacterium]
MSLSVALILASSWGRTIFTVFRHLGGFGLLLLGVLDSSFLFMPLGNDLLIIALVSSQRSTPHYLLGFIPMWVYFVIMASVGSMLGVLLVDLVMRKAGEEGLQKFVKPKQIEKLKRKMEKRAALAVIAATLMPPPFPFTAVILTASALQYPRKNLLLATLGGRLVRFTVEAMLAIYFGRSILRYMNSDIVEYIVYAFIVIAVVGSIFSIRKWLSGKGNRGSLRSGGAKRGVDFSPRKL